MKNILRHLLWSLNTNFHLTQQKIQSFQKNGFLLVEGALKLIK